MINDDRLKNNTHHFKTNTLITSLKIYKTKYGIKEIIYFF